ncbi:hypothetical protein [Polynucleobacter sp. AP-RePozz3-80-G7]|uniref:hypothetical protein n=1 Tax=Polynucleobacter sp. AP-RePozz3-80-G7 TaxID=2689105 RepID=UPI001C0AE173|nr:hypothetical protein [Polynucleobacter sp. AP-RePozz3-80-G7]MBU3639553.1 hypothetical protein [Polynucleobacter sp. AP-RePozz3-80-G7]
MSNFLSAFHIQIIPRSDIESTDESSHQAIREKLLLLISRICKDFRGTLFEESRGKIIYSFEQISFAAQAAMAIQIEADALNAKNHSDPICLASIGVVALINPFTGLREEERSIQLASFMAEAAGPGELYLSEGAHDSLKNPDLLLCRFTRQLLRTGEDRALNAYEVFWNPTEVDPGRLHKDPNGIDLELQPIRSFGLKLAAGVLLMFFGVLLLTVGWEALWVWFIAVVNR